ncbi:potassium channel family protein [Bordetella sp. 15P40C-2]|uniref:potassium channel family protein n=1 Tax=Bordetella sp. 15P40C-2 TaxID=2572246 RepID=UPI00192487A1|nr:potassium channel family protein [Bordetella sp. 15P40C-2]
MKRLNPAHARKIINALNVLAVIASVCLVVSVSLEAFSDQPFTARTVYFDVEFWICLYFIVDFFLQLLLAQRRWRFFRRYFVILLLSIPYLSLIGDAYFHLSAEQIYILRLVPLARGAAALVLIVSIIVRHNTTALFISYLIFLISVVYFITLIFYVVERGVNGEIKTYADSLWWAAMTVTTVGSTIQPVTVAGKIITTILAMLGMTIFPIFTAYITTIINRISQREITARAQSANLSNSPH